MRIPPKTPVPRFRSKMTAILPPLRPDPGLPVPEGLLDARRRDRLTRLGAGWPEAGRLGLPVGAASRAEAVAAGARIETDGRLSIGRGQAVHAPMQPFVPFLARRDYHPLRIDTIPASSWGGSLQNLLAPDCWDLLCSASLSHSGGVCEICGEGTGPIECHEVWDYLTPGAETVWGVQGLRKLLAVCGDCHRMFHPGLVADEPGRDAVRGRMRTVNGWTEAEETEFSSWQVSVTRLRSQYRWALDFTGWEAFGPLQVDGRYWMPDPEFGGVMADHGMLGRVRTKLLGTAWSIDGDLRAGEPAAPYLERAESSIVADSTRLEERCARAGEAEMRWQGLPEDQWKAVAHHAGELLSGRLDLQAFRDRTLHHDMEGYVVWAAGVLVSRGLLPEEAYAREPVPVLAARPEVQACMSGAEAEFMRLCHERGYLPKALAA